MEDLRLKLEDLKRRWEDDHRQLVRLAAAGDRAHVVQRERELRRFSGSTLDLQFAATEKQVRVSAQDAVTEGMAEELSLKELVVLVHGVVASQKVLTENVALQQATIHRLSKQQGELLQAMALTPMRHEHCNGNNRPLNDECYYCHRRGHFKRNCAALKRAQRNNAELASIARRHRGKRRGDSVVDSACLKQRQSSRESSSEARKQTFAKQRARLLAEHAKAMLARDRELETLEEKCRGLTQQLKAALDTHVMDKLHVECDALKQTIEDGDKKQHADDRTRITETCDEYVRRIIGDTEHVDGDIPGTVELCGRLDHERHLCVRLEKQTSQGETLPTVDKRNNRCTESPDEGISVSTGDTDDVDEKSREIVKSRRHIESERHQPERLTGRPRRLLGTQDQSAVVKTRRRCLPCVPAREANIGDIDMSAEAVREVLVRALERSRGEHSSETLCMPSRRDAGWRPNPLGLPRSVWAW